MLCRTYIYDIILSNIRYMYLFWVLYFTQLYIAPYIHIYTQKLWLTTFFYTFLGDFPMFLGAAACGFRRCHKKLQLRSATWMTFLRCILLLLVSEFQRKFPVYTYVYMYVWLIILFIYIMYIMCSLFVFYRQGMYIYIYTYIYILCYIINYIYVFFCLNHCGGLALDNQYSKITHWLRWFWTGVFVFFDVCRFCSWTH